MLDILVLGLMCVVTGFAAGYKIAILMNLIGVWTGLRIVRSFALGIGLKSLIAKLKLMLIGVIKTKLLPILFAWMIPIIMPVKRASQDRMPDWVKQLFAFCGRLLSRPWSVVKSVFWWLRTLILYLWFLIFALPWCCSMYVALWCAAILRILRLASGSTGGTVLYVAARGYLYLARKFLGVERDVVGAVPQGRVVIACNHQSMIDTVVILARLPSTVVVFRRSLLWATGLPWALTMIGMIPVYDCDFGLFEVLNLVCGNTDLHWLSRVRAASSDKNVCIFPEGCRATPQDAPTTKYHSGVVVIARDLRIEIAPAVINSGIIWGREFLPQLLAFGRTVTLEFLESQPWDVELSKVERMIKDRLQIC